MTFPSDHPASPFPRDDILWASIWLCKLEGPGSAYCAQVHDNWVASGGSNIFDWENVHAVATAQLLAMPEICTPLQRRTYSGGWLQATVAVMR